MLQALHYSLKIAVFPTLVEPIAYVDIRRILVLKACYGPRKIKELTAEQACLEIYY